MHEIIPQPATLPAMLAATPLAPHVARVEQVTLITIGESAAHVYRLATAAGSHSFLKLAPRVAGTLAGEADRIRWLHGRLPVPQLFAYHEDPVYSYLLMSALPGVDSATLAVERGMETATLVRLLGEGLRQIHATPWANCPFDHRLATEIERATIRTARGLVDESDFDEERQGRTAKSLLADLVATAPTHDDLVLTHGDYCLPNIMLADDQLSGFIDLGLAGLGDRYRDLALARRSLIRNCGEEWVAHFFASYGLAEPDEEKLAFYQLLDEFY